MNKNPERPENMNEIMFTTFSKNYKRVETELEKYQDIQKKIQKEIFGRYN